MTLLASILLLAVLVFVHEFAHLVAAVLLHAPLAEFAIGAGPALLRFHLRRPKPLAGVLFTLRLLPLGGFVRFATATPPTPDAAGTPRRRRWWQAADPLGAIRPGPRLLICLAGPVGSISGMTLLFAFALAVWGEPPPARITGFNPVAASRFEPALTAALEATQNPDVTAASLLEGQLSTPIARPEVHWTSLGPAALGKKAVRATAQAVVLIGEMTWWLTQNPAVVYDNLSGPVGIVNTGARLAATSTPHPLPTTAAVPRSEAPRIDTMSPRKAGGGPFHWPRPPELRGYALLVLYMGVLSVFLAFVNLLPLPPFDGYHAAVSALELLLRRPVPARLRAGLAIAGALLFLGLVARGTVNDVTRIRTGAPPVETAARS